MRPFAYSVYLFNDITFLYPAPPPAPHHTHTLRIDWGKQLILKPWRLDKAVRLAACEKKGIVLRIIKYPFGLHCGSGPGTQP